MNDDIPPPEDSVEYAQGKAEYAKYHNATVHTYLKKWPKLAKILDKHLDDDTPLILFMPVNGEDFWDDNPKHFKDNEYHYRRESDDAEIIYPLDPQKIRVLDLGKRKIKYYVQFEGEYTQYPSDIIQDGLSTHLKVAKILSDYFKWKIAEAAHRYDWLKYLAIAIIGTAILIVLFKMVVQQPSQIPVVAEAVSNLTKNVTAIGQSVKVI